MALAGASLLGRSSDAASEAPSPVRSPVTLFPATCDVQYRSRQGVVPSGVQVLDPPSPAERVVDSPFRGAAPLTMVTPTKPARREMAASLADDSHRSEPEEAGVDDVVN